MAANKPTTPPADPVEPNNYPDCVWMWATEPDGAVARAEVNAGNGSVEIMAALGWLLQKPAE